MSWKRNIGEDEESGLGHDTNKKTLGFVTKQHSDSFALDSLPIKKTKNEEVERRKNGISLFCVRGET